MQVMFWVALLIKTPSYSTYMNDMLQSKVLTQYTFLKERGNIYYYISMCFFFFFCHTRGSGREEKLLWFLHKWRYFIIWHTNVVRFRFNCDFVPEFGVDENCFVKFLVGVAMNSVRSGIDAERTWTVETGMSSFTVAKTLIDIILDIEVVAIVKVEIGYYQLKIMWRSEFRYGNTYN